MVKLDPWGSFQVEDYARLRDEFGIARLDESSWEGVLHPSPLFSRGVVFGHRGFEPVLAALRAGDPYAVMTGLMPSGRMHLGHKTVMDQVVWYQEHGGDVHIAVADFEAYATRNLTLPQAQQLAMDEYVLTYLALGLDPQKSEVYFQTRRSRVKDLAYALGLHVNMSQMRAIYGFEDQVKLAHLNAPLMQAGDILHVQRDEFGGPRPTVVPVGVDQDPHIRLTRDLAAATRVFSVQLTRDKKLGVFVKPEKPPRPVAELLDAAERVLRTDLGYGDVKRNDAYRALYLPGAPPSDVARIDLALGKYEATLGEPGFFPPASTYHRFMTGLTGGKMSSSQPESAIFITDEPAEVKKKLMRAKTGGRATEEEQRRKGADPTVCSVYETYLYHVADDKLLPQVYEECTTGKRLCGGCKQQALDLLLGKLKEIQEKREASRHLVKEIVSEN